MTRNRSPLSLLWTPSKRQVSLLLDGDAEAVAQRLQKALASSEEVAGRVVGRGVKIEFHPRHARQRGAFATVFYGLIQG